MPYLKLITMQKFSKLRVRQLFDDCRIFAAWFSSLLDGKTITDQKTKKQLTKKDVILRYAHARGLLIALGYPIKHTPGGKKPTPAFAKLTRLAKNSIQYYYDKYKGKVEVSKS
jgi:hypothetical protein